MSHESLTAIAIEPLQIVDPLNDPYIWVNHKDLTATSLEIIG